MSHKPDIFTHQQNSSHRPSRDTQTRHIYTSAELISQAFTCHTNQTYLHISRTHLTDLHVSHKPDIFTHQQNSSHRPSRVTQTRHIYTSAELISQAFTCHTNQTYLHISRTHLIGLHVSHKPDIFTHQQNSSHRPSRVSQTGSMRHIYTSAVHKTPIVWSIFTMTTGYDQYSFVRS